MVAEGDALMGLRLSHAGRVRPYPEDVKVREPVARPLDIVWLELLLSASQAFLVGVLMYLAVGVWDDRGVGFGPVAIILAMLGLAIGASWLYWLVGGVGWPLAASNVPAAMFLGFALVLGWGGEDLVGVEGMPLLLSLLASVYGLVCGAFLDSPRRWRWDQRQRLRPGTSVPRISPATRMLAGQLPRSIPRRSATVALAAGRQPARPAPGTPGLGAASSPPAPSGVADEPDRDAPGAIDDLPDTEGDRAPAATSAAGTGPAATPGDRGTASAGAPAAGSTLPPGPAGEASTPGHEPGAIELPTSIEPKAQRSPWAWAAPPDWTRDEEDQPSGGRGQGRS
jgi:hypothetical protein